LLCEEGRLPGAVGNQDILHAIHTLHFSSVWINPIDQLIQIRFGEDNLVLGAQKVAQIDAPVSVTLTPPIEVDVKTCFCGRFDQTHALDVSQGVPPLIDFQTDCVSAVFARELIMV
jgi:hypothetical protein